MYRRIRLPGFAVLVAAILLSCATTKAIREVPTYSQGQEVNLEDDLKFRIEGAYWTNQIQYQKADAAFLVIEMSIINTAKKTTVTAPPVFTLVNEQGYEYEVSYRGIAGGGPADNFIEKLTVARLSPLMPVKGKVVFDVPKGSYELIVSRGKRDERRVLRRGPDLLKYRLSVAER